jgi:hypothetical protein
MQKSVISLIAAAAVVGIAAIGIRPVATVAEPAPTDVRPADLPPQPFNPQLSALMNMIIQPRHAKLGLVARRLLFQGAQSRLRRGRPRGSALEGFADS